MDLDQMFAYTQSILSGDTFKEYKAVQLDFKQSANDLVGDKWTLGELKGLSTDDFCSWSKRDGLAYDGDS